MKKDGMKGELARNSRQFVRAKMNATGFKDPKFFQTNKYVCCTDYHLEYAHGNGKSDCFPENRYFYTNEVKILIRGRKYMDGWADEVAS